MAIWSPTSYYSYDNMIIHFVLWSCNKPHIMVIRSPTSYYANMITQFLRWSYNQPHLTLRSYEHPHPTKLTQNSNSKLLPSPPHPSPQLSRLMQSGLNVLPTGNNLTRESHTAVTDNLTHEACTDYVTLESCTDYSVYNSETFHRKSQNRTP